MLLFFKTLFSLFTGHLTFWVAKAIENLKNSSVLLVERASHRHKQDNKLDKSDGKVLRVRADIEDLVLKKVEATTDKKVVGVTKHLCGVATGNILIYRIA